MGLEFGPDQVLIGDLTVVVDFYNAVVNRRSVKRLTLLGDHREDSNLHPSTDAAGFPLCSHGDA